MISLSLSDEHHVRKTKKYHCDAVKMSGKN
jgi:hypothetical protein